MWLVYKLSRGEGPERKKLAAPFDIQVTPDQPWEVKNPAFAAALLEAFPGKIVECSAPAPETEAQAESEDASKRKGKKSLPSPDQSLESQAEVSNV